MAVGLGEPEVLPYLERTNQELRGVSYVYCPIIVSVHMRVVLTK